MYFWKVRCSNVRKRDRIFWNCFRFVARRYRSSLHCDLFHPKRLCRSNDVDSETARTENNLDCRGWWIDRKRKREKEREREREREKVEVKGGAERSLSFIQAAQWIQNWAIILSLRCAKEHVCRWNGVDVIQFSERQKETTLIYKNSVMCWTKITQYSSAIQLQIVLIISFCMLINSRTVDSFSNVLESTEKCFFEHFSQYEIYIKIFIYIY